VAQGDPWSRHVTAGATAGNPSHALASSLLKQAFMPHTKSRLALELWCHAVDTLLAKGASFADALDGANVILQAHKRQNEAAQAEAAGENEREQRDSSSNSGGPLLSGM
jgi:hypothetical protein